MAEKKTQSKTDDNVVDGYLTHEVEHGEDLLSISQKYSLSVSALANLNGLRTGYRRVNPGDKLRIRQV